MIWNNRKQRHRKSFCVHEQNLPSQNPMNGNTARVNTSTPRQYWHVSTTLPAILKFDSVESQLHRSFPGLLFSCFMKKVSRSSRLKYQSYFRGVHRNIRRFHISLRTVFVALQNFFSSEIAQVLHKYSIRYYLLAHERKLDEKTDLVSCKPKKLISRWTGKPARSYTIIIHWMVLSRKSQPAFSRVSWSVALFPLTSDSGRVCQSNCSA